MYVPSLADQWVYRQFCAAQAVAKCQLGISALGERIRLLQSTGTRCAVVGHPVVSTPMKAGP
jgi:hypothetical protein